MSALDAISQSYDKQEKISKGRFSCVYRGFNVTSRKIVAIKEVKRDNKKDIPGATFSCQFRGDCFINE